MPQPDELVLHAFRASARDAANLTHMGYVWDNGWRGGDVVYTHAAEYAAWSATVRERLAIPGGRIARPVRASNGRFTVGGWKATSFIPGRVARRVDETVALALRLEPALADAAAAHPAPQGRTDVFAQAERAAWDEDGEAYAPLPADVALYTGHADLLACTIYPEGVAPATPPAIVDIVPTAAPRPVGYTAALVMVDGLIHNAVDPAVVDRFGHIPHLEQLLLRAVAYRRHVNNLHPHSRAHVRAEIERVESLLVSRVNDTIA